MNERHKKVLRHNKTVHDTPTVVVNPKEGAEARIESTKYADNNTIFYDYVDIMEDGTFEYGNITEYIFDGSEVESFEGTMSADYMLTKKDSDPDYYQLFMEYTQGYDPVPLAEDLELPFAGETYHELFEFFLREDYADLIMQYDELELEYLSRVEFKDEAMHANMISLAQEERDQAMTNMLYSLWMGLSSDQASSAVFAIRQFLSALAHQGDAETEALCEFLKSAPDVNTFFSRIRRHLRLLEN